MSPLSHSSQALYFIKKLAISYKIQIKWLVSNLNIAIRRLNQKQT